MTRSVSARSLDEHLSVSVSCILIVMYVANLMYTLLTHRDVFAFAHDGDDDASRSDTRHWSLWQALAVLGAATVATTVQAHMMSVGFDTTASATGLSPFFLGVIGLAIVGNTAKLRRRGVLCEARSHRIGHQHNGRINHSSGAAGGSSPRPGVSPHFPSAEPGRSLARSSSLRLSQCRSRSTP